MSLLKKNYFDRYIRNYLQSIRLTLFKYELVLLTYLPIIELLHHRAQLQNRWAWSTLPSTPLVQDSTCIGTALPSAPPRSRRRGWHRRWAWVRRRQWPPDIAVWGTGNWLRQGIDMWDRIGTENSPGKHFVKSPTIQFFQKANNMRTFLNMWKINLLD